MYTLRETCEKEFKTITDYIPVVQSHLHDDGDDKATDAYDQDHEGTDDDEGAYVADNGDDDGMIIIIANITRELVMILLMKQLQIIRNTMIN